MSYSIYLQLCLDELKPIMVELQLADRSIRRPKGIIEDVLVQIHKFYYLIDFLVIDTQLRIDLDSKVPLILGRSFLATANTNINCRNVLMTLSFGNMTLEVNIFHDGKQPRVEKENKCDSTNLINTLVAEEVSYQLDFKSLDPSLYDNVSNSWLYHNMDDPLLVVIMCSWRY